MGSRIEQVKDELRKIFDLVDADHNGKIDKKEAKVLIDNLDAHVLERFGEELDTPQHLVDKLFRKLDIDGDGGVDFDECFIAFRQVYPEDLEAYFDGMKTSEFVAFMSQMEVVVACLQEGDFGPLGSMKWTAPYPDHDLTDVQRHQKGSA